MSESESWWSNYLKKVSLYMIICALVEKLIFQYDASGHLGFRALAKNAGIFGRDIPAKKNLNGP